ncbi:MAG TPA: hypothetical protein VMB79_01375 [Jatrophihabitans sp.]|nr:hypothetical protein [Jatrophihabitans sp.]
MELIPAGRPVTASPDYDGVRFGAVDGSSGHAVGHYHQDGEVVTAEIAGGGVRTGRLVGTVGPHGVIEAGYCMILTGGEVVAGRCVSTPSLLPDGRILLTERWNRLDGSAGTSHIATLAQPTAGDGTRPHEARSAEGASP